MEKYSVDVLKGFGNEDSYSETVFETDSPVEAIKRWLTENRKHPTVTAIMTTRAAYNDELYKAASDNLDAICKYATDLGYSSPFLSYLREQVAEANSDKSLKFHEYEGYDGQYYPDQVEYVFNFG